MRLMSYLYHSCDDGFILYIMLSHMWPRLYTPHCVRICLARRRSWPSLWLIPPFKELPREVLDDDDVVL